MTNISGENGEVARVALLIDGENIPASYAGRIIAASGSRECLLIKRVYGNAQVLNGWAKAPGFRVIHSGTGKNSADMLLSIQAVDMLHSGDVNAFVIASSDGDFSHLAHYLREKGCHVLGIGEPKTPDGFEKACTQFVTVLPEKEETQANLRVISQASEKPKVTPVENDINQKITQIIRDSKIRNGIRVALLGARMNSKYGTKLEDVPDRTWRKYLDRWPELFECDPVSKDACVRLKSFE